MTDKTTARKLWKDAPADDSVLGQYLAAAERAVLAYAPEDDYEHGAVPYDLAIVMQARNIYNSAKAGPSGDFDGSGFGLSAYPLDWQVKQLLRPQRGIGAIV